MRPSPEEAAFILRCRDDFGFFCGLLKIVDKQARLVTLVPHEGQREILGLLLTVLWLFILKSRRIGSTTIIAAWVLWRVIFHPHLEAAVIAHVGENEIFSIYQTFYENLPELLRRYFPLTRSSVREMRFAHGGRIVVSSARSGDLVGGGFQIVHATEVARYANVHDMIRKVFAAADGAATLILETTPQGVNEAFHFWHGSGSFSQSKFFTKHFVSWLKDPTAVVLPGDRDYVPPFEDAELAAFEAEYTATHHLTDHQRNFLRTQLVKLGGSFDSLHQEFAASPEQGFLLSGRPFLRRTYPEALTYEVREGEEIHAEPAQYHRYLAGIDTASGSPAGDFSAVSVVDASTPGDHRVVAALYVRMEVVAFAERALALCRRFNAFATIERNNHGIVVVQHFKRAAYPYLYRTVQQARIGDEASETLGFDTSPSSRAGMFMRFQSLLNGRKLDPVDLRLKHELNSLVYRKDGTPGAAGSAHDDLSVATALAEEGDEQAGEIHAIDAAYLHRPRNPVDVIAFEVATGTLYDSTEAFADDRDADHVGFSLGNLLG